ncbi:MAG: hypothetical protein H8E49_09870 [Gammaproteobacteria bacterium]|nr:hypothetical protein [Gammaproteobacteria bacterium]
MVTSLLVKNAAFVIAMDSTRPGIQNGGIFGRDNGLMNTDGYIALSGRRSERHRNLRRRTRAALSAREEDDQP